jgi:hypothetical protein
MDYSFVRDRKAAIFIGPETTGIAACAFVNPSDAADYLQREAELFGAELYPLVVEVNDCRARADVFLTRKHFVAWARIAQGLTEGADLGEVIARVVGRYEAQETRRVARAAAWAAEESR